MSHLYKLGLVVLLASFSVSAFAVEGGSISSGEGTIETSAQHTDIRQSSSVLITDWRSFDIAAGESVQAHQPSASAKLLIRVGGNRATNIAGEFTANGVVILQNTAGIEFAQGSVVNVGGLIATSGRVSTDHLNDNGGTTISNSTASVVNRGAITGTNSDVVFVGAQVENHGTITIEGADVLLGAGESFLIYYNNSELFSVETASANARLTNSGTIVANGGSIEFEARALAGTRSEVVAIGGTVDARRSSALRRGGYVYVSGGAGITRISADVDAEEIVYIAARDYIVIGSGADIYAPKVYVGARTKGGLINYSNKHLQPIAKRILVEADARLATVPDGYSYLTLWSSDKVWVYGTLISDDITISAKGELDHSSHGRRYSNEKNGIGYIDLSKVSAGSISLYFNDVVFGDEASAAPVLADGVLSEHNADTYIIDVSSLNAIASLAGDDALANRTASYVFFWANNIAVNSEIDVSNFYNLYLLANKNITIASSINTNKGNLIVSARGNINFGAAEDIKEAVIKTAQAGEAGEEEKTRIDVLGNDIVLYSGLDEPSNQRARNIDVNIHARTGLTLGLSIDLGRGDLSLAVADGTLNVVAYKRKLVFRGNRVSIAYTKAYKRRWWRWR